MRLFDTHAHLTDERYGKDRGAVLQRAAALELAVLTAATCPRDAREALRLAQTNPNVYAAVGFYPHDTGDLTEADWSALRVLLDENRDRPPQERRIVAIGEIGLDHYRDRVAPDTQRRAFARLLQLARDYQLPALIHCRQAEDELRPMLDDFVRDGGRAAWHCFSTRREAYAETVAWAAERGVRLGLGGMATWPDAKALRGAVGRIPDELLLLETDAPYLAPRPTREERDAAAAWAKARSPQAEAAWNDFLAGADKRNEPLGVLAVAASLARLRGVTVDDVARIATRNACELFGLPLPHDEALAKVAYVIRDQLYIALTNRCSNDCGFCARNHSWVVKGHDVRLDHEPDADEVMAAIDAAGGLSPYRELVFCGFGEPTLRLEVLTEVCRRVRARGAATPIRVNTNGNAGLLLGRDPVPELAAAVDTVSVSLNAADAATYARLCAPRSGEAAYAELERFVRACVAAGLRTVCTAVEVPGLDIDAVARHAEALGAEFRGRGYDNVG